MLPFSLFKPISSHSDLLVLNFPLKLLLCNIEIFTAQQCQSDNIGIETSCLVRKWPRQLNTSGGVHSEMCTQF